MTDKAIIQGCYVDLRFMPGLKCARVFVDIPIEHSNAFLKMFDAPDRANPVPVVIARLTTPTAEQPSGAQAPATKRDRVRSEWAALRLRDVAFQDWVLKAAEAGSGIVWQSADGREKDADRALKHMLDIRSKTELDSDPEKAAEWDRLWTSFQVRDQVR